MLLKRELELMKHMGAIYMYEIILLWRDGESNKEKGLYFLDMVKNLTHLKECRARVKCFIVTIWVRNHSLEYQELNICCVKTCKNIEVGVRRDKSGACFWEGQGDKHFQACMAANKVSAFCKIFK